jgi:UDP-N-acetylmuramoyl-tripeptide--D-alanyl-D-alanine ligase
MRLIRAIVRRLKKRLYFFVAGYFAYWARIYLRRWNPTVITVTGSSGKTTLLHLFEAQLGETARYSHGANSAFGIPFHILGLERSSYRWYEWALFALKAPMRAYRPICLERIYVTEADAERPHEGAFVAELLRPHVVVWLSLEEAHGMQYDSLIRGITLEGAARLNRLKCAIAHEFGWFVEYAQDFVVLDRSNEYIARQASRTKVAIAWVEIDEIQDTEVRRDGVSFGTADAPLTLPHLAPLEAGHSVVAVAKVLNHLRLPIDRSFTRFTLPPGRSSVLTGVRGTTLIDSSYNGTMDGMRAMLGLFARYPSAGEKWVVLGDMIEQGKSEAYEHELLAPHIAQAAPARVVLVGPRLAAHTRPALTSLPSDAVVCFDRPDEAYAYIARELKGGETLLFKGARYLEGIVEKLLAEPADAAKLCRRGALWDAKRKLWGV